LLLAFAAPFVRRIKYRVPEREKRIILLFFLLFVLFCAANQYSWLQPLTGFRYLIPVVPGLALLAIETSQILPRRARWALAIASCAYNFLIVTAYQPDLRLAVPALRHRGFALPWMMRLRQVGIPLSGGWVLGGYLLLAVGIGAMWAVPIVRKRGVSLATAERG
jgi:hypothetical protein